MTTDVSINGKLVRLVFLLNAELRLLTFSNGLVIVNVPASGPLPGLNASPIGSVVGAVKLVRLVQSLNKLLLFVVLLKRQVLFSNLTVLIHSWYCAAKD